jgi:hypothetical protein
MSGVLHARPRMRVMTKQQPMVRKEWLIAMAIVFVALMAVFLLHVYNRQRWRRLTGRSPS